MDRVYDHYKQGRGVHPNKQSAKKSEGSSDDRIARRKAASESLRGKLRAPAGGPATKNQDRHVTFQENSLGHEVTSIHPAYRRPVSGRAGDVTAVDHQIARG